MDSIAMSAFAGQLGIALPDGGGRTDLEPESDEGAEPETNEAEDEGLGEDEGEAEQESAEGEAQDTKYLEAVARADRLEREMRAVQQAKDRELAKVNRDLSELTNLVKQLAEKEDGDALAELENEEFVSGKTVRKAMEKLLKSKTEPAPKNEDPDSDVEALRGFKQFVESDQGTITQMKDLAEVLDYWNKNKLAEHPEISRVRTASGQYWAAKAHKLERELAALKKGKPSLPPTGPNKPQGRAANRSAPSPKIQALNELFNR